MTDEPKEKNWLDSSGEYISGEISLTPVKCDNGFSLGEISLTPVKCDNGFSLGEISLTPVKCDNGFSLGEISLTPVKCDPQGHGSAIYDYEKRWGLRKNHEKQGEVK